MYVSFDEVQGKTKAFKTIIGVTTDADYNSTTLINSV